MDVNKVNAMERKNVALQSEVDRLKQQLTAVKSKSFIGSSPMKGSKMDSLSRATSLLSFGSDDS